MTLYRKELWRILLSLVFLLTAAGTVLFAYTQGVFPPTSSIAEPREGAPTYGMKASNDPELIMPEAAQSLFAEYSANQYTTYPNGFYKSVKLNQAKREKMGEIIAELNPDITWQRFCELMTEVDALLGGGSYYCETWISHHFGQIPVTYEEALADYQLTVSYDKLTGAHARLFSDYMGIILGILPIFPAVFLCLRDRRNIAPVLYTRRISSAHFIVSRFLALITAVMLPVLIMCAILTVIHAMDYGITNIDVLAYFKYAIFWLLPTAMATTALGMLLTTLTNTPIAIAVQILWWFADMLGGSGAYSFFGVRPLQLMPRHNDLGSTAAYIDYLPELIQNRIIFTLIAILLVALTILAFSAKRRGLLHVPIYKHSKIQSAL